jgi:uncharacterized RDD family membrane protein YckC
MKCPKCGYLGFEDTDRCRNCGYDFSMSAPAAVHELPLRAEAPIERSPVEEELPLFGANFPSQDDEPLIKRASPPRVPLSVRRSTPEIPRLRQEETRAQPLDLAPEDSPAVSRPAATALRRELESRRRTESSVVDAGIPERAFAAAIDLLILAVVDALVIYFTLQICGLTTQDLALLPRGPLVAFLIVQNGGYLVAFTAGGQTLGKMAAGIRVVAAEPAATLDVARALVREAMWLLLAAPAGLGFLPTLFARDHRGLHDRLAGTRVVR